MSKHRKAKPTLKPEALAWLARHSGDTEWQRILDLHRLSIDALFAYVRSASDDASYQEFMDLVEPEAAAERKKKEAEAAEAARKESLTIHTDGKMPSPYTNLRQGSAAPVWRAAQLTEAERAEAAKLAEEERTGTREIPRPEFEPNET